MTYRLPPLNALRAFESAARHLSFKKAAAELHVTPAAISQQIKQLENYFNLSLFTRLTRALEITPQGLAMLPNIRQGFECLAACVEISRSPTAEILTINAPPSFASRWLVPRLARFAEKHPGISLRLSSTGNTVDGSENTVLEEAVVDPRSPSSELAIRFGTGHYPGQVVEKIFFAGMYSGSSPTLPTVEHPLAEYSDLRFHLLIHDETIGYETNRQADWQHWLHAAGIHDIDVRHGTHFSNAVLAIEAAINGQGIALALKPLVETDLACGRLIAPFALTVPSSFAYFLVMPKSISERAAVTAFREWLLVEGNLASGHE